MPTVSPFEAATSAGQAAGLAFAFLPSLNDLCRDQLVAFSAVGDEREVTNDKGTDSALPCRLVVVTPGTNGQKPTWTDHGIRDIFWNVVRSAIKANTSPEIPWYCGRLRRMPGKRPYFEVRPPTPDEMYMFVEAITNLDGRGGR